MKLPVSHYEFKTEHPRLNNTLVALVIAIAVAIAYWVEPGIIKISMMLLATLMPLAFEWPSSGRRGRN